MRNSLWEISPLKAEVADSPAWVMTCSPLIVDADGNELIGGAAAGAGRPERKQQADPWVYDPAGEFDLTNHSGCVRGETPGRQPVLCRLIGRHLRRGDTPRTILSLALLWNQKNSPPLDEGEVQKTVAGLMKADARKLVTMGWSPTPSSSPSLSPSVDPELAAECSGGNSPAESNSPGADGAELDSAEIDTAGRSGGEQPAEGGVNYRRGDSADASDEQQPAGEEEVGRGEGGKVSDCDPEQEPNAEVPSTPPPSTGWPVLHPGARHGLMGEILSAVEPQLENNPEPFAFALLAAVGNAVGPSVTLNMGTAGFHAGNLFGVVVAPSGAGKSEPWAVASWLMSRADPQWQSDCVAAGLGTGEGLIDRVRDELRVTKFNKRTGLVEEEVVPGAAEKRVLVVEAEFGRVLSLGRRDGATLTPTLCCGWDGKPLEVANRGMNKLKATGHHVSIWGNITDAELHKRMAVSIEAVNGFGNRFLWLRLEWRRDLSRGGNLSVLAPFVEKLSEVIRTAREAGAVTWDDEAGRLWDAAYGRLRRVQGDMPALGRARAQALRLTLLYTLLDGSQVIRPEHVRAGLAAWAWCEGSARSIFGGGEQRPAPAVAAEPEPLWQRVWNLVVQMPEIKRSEIGQKFKHEADAFALDVILQKLEAKGLIRSQMVQPEGGGRPAECWWPGGEQSDTPSPSPSSPDVTAESPAETNSAVINSDAETDGGVSIRREFPPEQSHGVSGSILGAVLTEEEREEAGRVSDCQPTRCDVAITDVTDPEPDALPVDQIDTEADEPLTADEFLAVVKGIDQIYPLPEAAKPDATPLCQTDTTDGEGGDDDDFLGAYSRERERGWL